MPLNSKRTIALRHAHWFDLNQPIFFHSTDGKPGNVRTNVTLKEEDGALTVDFECLDDPYLAANSYTEDNTDLWRQEVFEVFIAAGTETPQRYLELEINPNNAFFAAWVDNKDGLGPENLTMLSQDMHGIQHHVSKGESKWQGSISIPLSLLSDNDEKKYRINFYRIVLRSKPTESNWECAPDNCDFLCWSPTMSETTPAFHRPAYFGSLSIEE